MRTLNVVEVTNILLATPSGRRAAASSSSNS
jgi:hypothetical protein